MTLQERKSIISILRTALQTKETLGLNQVPHLLTEGGVPKEAYGSLKKTLENQFSDEFSVFGTNGREVVCLNQTPIASFYRLLTEAYPPTQPATITTAVITEMVRKSGLDNDACASTDAIQRLIRIYPTYSLQEGAVVTPAATVQEFSCIQALFSINWRLVATRIHQLSGNTTISADALRDQLLIQFSKVLLTGEGLLTDISDEAEARIALATGYETAEKAAIYCILRAGNAAQPWSLVGVAYPGENDSIGLGLWLTRKFFPKGGIQYDALRNQVAELTALQETLKGNVQGLLAALETGIAPTPLSSALQEYEALWATLNDSLSQSPTLEEGIGKPLAQIAQLLEEKNKLTDMSTVAVSLFQQIFDGTARTLDILQPAHSVTDMDVISALFHTDNIRGDVQLFQDKLKPYICLKEVLCSTDRSAVSDSIDTVSDHFGLRPMDVLRYLLGYYSEKEHAFLALLPELEATLDNFMLAATQESTPAEAPKDADAIADIVYHEAEKLPLNWITLYQNLLPQVSQLRSTILSGCQTASDLTPSGVAARILAAQQNQDRLAECYLLLGLYTDRKSCVPALLSLYRQEESEDRFLQLWNSGYRQDDFTPVDACYWLELVCREDTVSWDEIEAFLDKHPQIKQSPEYRDAMLKQLSRSGNHPDAYHRWLRTEEPTLNALEAALAGNDIDTVYQLLTDPEKRAQLAYTEQELECIRQAVAEGLPGGVDTYAKAARLYSAQKNKNNAAEILLWTSPLNKPALTLLFDIYSAAGDHRSLCWMCKKFSVPTTTFTRAAAYADALQATQEYALLSALLWEHPELWHRNTLLTALTDEHWVSLCAREAATPISSDVNGFVRAIIEDDTNTLNALLADEAQMTQWGYSEDTLQSLREKLSSGNIPTGTDRVSVVKRFNYCLGNLHRALEAYLYRQFDADPDWASQHLFALAFREGRYMDAARYYETRSQLSAADSNTTMYMWCLLHQDQTEALFALAKQRPDCLRTDSALVDAVLDAANRMDMPEFSESIRQMIELLPKNGFEKAVMAADQMELQRYISDPDLLTAMGYSPEKISRFKDQIAQPLSNRMEPFNLAFRMQQFFGNLRALPFLENTREDTRAARFLFDIYYTNKRWDDICSIYREHLSSGIWSAVQQQRYIEALACSHSEENCRFYLEHLQDQDTAQKESPAYQWNYFHALVGTQQEEAAITQLQALSADITGYDYDMVLNTFDLVWKNGSKALRQQTALFAARMYLSQMGAMPLSAQKALLSMNGNLLKEEDPQAWIALFAENDLQKFSTILMCHFNYGIGEDPESIANAADALFALLDTPEGRCSNSLLTAVTGFALDKGLLTDATSSKVEALLTAWTDIAFTRNAESDTLELETLTDTEFSFLYQFWNEISLTDDQIASILTVCFRDLDAREDLSPIFFHRIAALLPKILTSSAYDAHSQKLTDAFTRWVGRINEGDTDSYKTVVNFLKATQFSYAQMLTFLNACAERSVLFNNSVQEAILAKCEETAPELKFMYLQTQYTASSQEEQRQQALTRARQTLLAQELNIEPDNASLQFVYSIACTDPAAETLGLLHRLYRKTDKADQADILENLLTLTAEVPDMTALRSWFFRTMEERSTEWIQQYSQWWAPLVCLQPADNQTKSILAYLSDDETSMQYTDAVLRLLLNDITNTTYLRCYARLDKELPIAVAAKLTYIRALQDDTTCNDAIRWCIAQKQYLYAARLLANEVKTVPANAVFIGQSAGDIFTEEALALCPELAELVPAVYRCIIRLNNADPTGAWKNIGRAVQMAILTQQEALFFDIFNQEYQNMYITYSGKCAALIANLMLRGAFDTAQHYLQEYAERNRSDPYLYMALLSSMVPTCLETGVLTEEDDILLRSIPISGNMRPLELYGSLVHYAMEKGCLKACANAFFRLCSYAQQDKALLAACIQLYSAVADSLDISHLYDVAKAYLDVAQDTLISRTCRLLAVISACDPRHTDYVQLLNDCQDRLQDSAALEEITKLKKECVRFLESAEEYETRKNFLLRAATGWWQIDEQTAGYFTTAPSLCIKLADIYPTSFFSACFTAALRYPSLYNTILAQLITQDYKWGQTQLQAIVDYPADLRETLAKMTDAPMDLPGLYACCLEQALQEPKDDIFSKKLSILLTVQRNFLSKQYEDNMYFLKEKSEATSNARRNEISTMLFKKSIEGGIDLPLPRNLIEVGEYDKAVIAAEKQLELGNENRFFVTLNSTYLDLAKFMSSSAGSKKYTLGQMMNMTTLLCQSNYYTDIDKLLDACPAKWKLCLRTVQEFIQGNPQNVAYLLSKDAFRIHDGCYKFVYTLANSYLTNSDWLNLIKRENRANARPDNWGIFSMNSFPLPTLPSTPFLLRASNRKPANLDSYTEFVDTYVNILAEQDAKSVHPANSKQDTVLKITPQATPITQDESLWQIPYVADLLQRYQAAKPQTDGQNEDEETASTPTEETKATLLQELDKNHTDEEVVDICGKLLVQLHQEPITGRTKKVCIDLGMALYRMLCTQKGMALYATEDARRVLYSMAPCFDGPPATLSVYSASLKAYVRSCLESYTDLSQITGDCMRDDLLKLCDAFGATDKDAAACLKKHILFTRDIGKKMREAMTNTDRLKWLQDCISACRNIDHPVETQAKEALAALLNQEIRAFHNKTQIHLTIYNSEAIRGKCCIYGKVTNLGKEPASKLVLSLTLNGVFVVQHTLSSLSGLETVPFALPCSDPENADTLSYKITLRYITADGTEESITPEVGELKLCAPEETKKRYKRYDASNPADSTNYVERASITTTLESAYLVDGGFSRFPNFAIYGMKRSGKSSVLRRLGRLLNEHYPDDVLYVIVSCEGITGDIYARAHAVFVKNVMDELDFKFNMQSMDGWQEFYNKWDVLPEAISDFRWLDSFYTALNHQWLKGKGIVVLIDEIERLYFDLGEDNSYLSSDAESYVPQSVDASNTQSVLWDVINKMTQRDGSSVRFVLCGSDFFTSKIIAEGDNLTQFFQKGVKLNVDRMEFEEIQRALTANTSITLLDDTIEYLWDIAAGLPWHSKIFCNSVIETQLIRQSEATRSTVYPSDIQDAVDLILSTTKDITSPANFGLLSLDPIENLVVQTVANALDSRLKTVSFDDLMEQLSQADKDSTPPELFAKALRSLVNERKLLKLDKSRNYQFGCELYRMYLRRELPPRFL